MTMDDSRPPATVDWGQHALFLDFDGTLTPIVARPELVALAPTTRGLIATLVRATSGAVAIISGRSLADLATHTGDLGVTLSGSHGLELRQPGQEITLHGQFSDALSAAARALSPVAEAHNLLLEHKPGAVALHYRARPDCGDIVRRAVEDTARDLGLRHMHGNLVSEAAPRGIDKGTALAGIMAQPPFAGRRPVMIGDDTTDEDGFASAQNMGGFGLRIGGTDTCARYRVADMDSALAWLDRSLRE